MSNTVTKQKMNAIIKQGHVEVSSPTRVDLAGGTLDCWPLYNFVGPCWTVNLSISIYTGVNLKVNDSERVVIRIKDLDYEREFSSFNEYKDSADKELGLIQAVTNYWPLESGFELETYSQSPVGGGLGGSSSLVVSLLKAFGQLFSRSWQLNNIVTVGHNIESSFLKTATGTQDYVPAAQAGLNLIYYTQNGFNIETIDYDQKYFSDRMTIVFTGKSHHSGVNNWQVLQDAVAGDKKTLSALFDVATVASEMRELCLQQDWEGLPELFEKEYEARIKLSSTFSSPEILTLQKLALRKGANSVKICGAGGGGCVMIWSPPEKKAEICQEIQSQGYQVLVAEPLKN